MTYFKYQQKAIEELYEVIDEHLDFYKTRKNKNKIPNTKDIHFIAPTGSGKTIMAFGLMDMLAEKKENLVFIWIAPNTLHYQSLEKFRNLSDKTVSNLLPIDSDEIESDNTLNANEILCLNWSSLDKTSNLLIKENETGRYLDNIIKKTKDDDKIIIALIDESHIASQNQKTKAYEFLQKLNSVLQIEITATPKNISLHDDKVEVIEDDVKAEGVIKKQFIFNDFSDENINDEKLIKYAYNKLQEITKMYEKYTNGKIIPLMIIQIENENVDECRKEQVKIEKYLENIGLNIKKDIAYYLSEDKSKSENLAKNDNPIQIVFTKTAIATGWDCPRASVLLTFRKSKDDKFKTQVLGRINRMPELKHYDEILLDSAYVYANVTKYIPNDLTFKVKTAIEANNETVTIKKGLKNIISLPYFQKWMVIEKFYKSEYDIKQFIEKKCLNFIKNAHLDIKDITSDIIQNLKIEHIQDIAISKNNAKYMLTTDEIQKIVSYSFARSGFEEINIKPKQGTLFEVEKSLVPFDTIHLLNILKKSLNQLQNKSYNYLDIYKIILNYQNYANFIKLLSDIKNESYKKRLSKVSKDIIFDELEEDFNFMWNPENEFICDKSILKKLSYKSLYNKDCVKDFNTFEKLFISLLEDNKNVKYWYRNGSTNNYFCIPYKKNNIIREFFPDFIVLYNDDTIGIYDTKCEMTASDGEAKDKAEYLYMYCEKYGYKNGLIKIEKKVNINYFKINCRENYTNYDVNNVEWEEFGILNDEKNLFNDL